MFLFLGFIVAFSFWYVVFEDGNQSRDFVSVHDIVQANLLAMDKSSANYDYFNVGAGPISLKFLQEAKLSEVIDCGRNLKHFPVTIVDEIDKLFNFVVFKCFEKPSLM